MKDWGLANVTLNVADGSMRDDISSWLVFVVLVAVFAVAVLAPAPVAATAAIGGEVSGIATVAIGGEVSGIATVAIGGEVSGIAIAAIGGEVSGIATAFGVVGRVVSGNSASLLSTPVSLAHKLGVS